MVIKWWGRESEEGKNWISVNSFACICLRVFEKNALSISPAGWEIMWTSTLIQVQHVSIE